MSMSGMGVSRIGGVRDGRPEFTDGGVGKCQARE